MNPDLLSACRLPRRRPLASGEARRLHPLIHRLREERLRQGITQHELSHRMEYNRNSVSRWEAGYADPSISAFMDWAGALGAEVTLKIDDEVIG